MTKEKAIAKLPPYASEDLPLPNIPRHAKEKNPKNEFLKRYGIALFVIAVFTIYSILLISITNHMTEKRVKEEYECDGGIIAQEIDKAVQDYKDRQSAERFKADDASKEDAIETLSVPISEHIAGLRMERNVTAEGAITYIWGVDLSRLDSGKYGDIFSILNGNIEGYYPNHSVRNEDKEIGREIARMYINGERPDGWTPDLEFAEINADGSVTARNQLYTGSLTKFWKWKA